MWHDIWKANDQPSEGITVDLRCKIRSEYHKVYKMVMRREREIKSDKIAEAFLNKHTDSFGREARKIHPKKVYYPNKVDDASRVKEIIDMFADKFDKLYNCVSYNVEDMIVLKHDIENAVGSKYMCNYVHCNHSITFTDCYDVIKKLMLSKSDGCTLTDHIIHAGDRLACYLALLFTSILCHGSSPGTMIPVPKGI